MEVKTIVIGGIVAAGLAWWFIKENQGPAEDACSLRRIGNWAQSTGRFWSTVVTRAELPSFPPGTPANQITQSGQVVTGVVVKNECTVFTWNGTQWAIDSVETADLRKFTGVK